jgi:hypothetical protein
VDVREFAAKAAVKPTKSQTGFTAYRDDVLAA